LESALVVAVRWELLQPDCRTVREYRERGTMALGVRDAAAPSTDMVRVLDLKDTAEPESLRARSVMNEVWKILVLRCNSLSGVASSEGDGTLGKEGL
jgi:hypothetical protein